MKWNRWIIKAAKIITKFTELGYWMMAALMLTAGIYSFADRTFLADALAGSIRTGRLELSVLGFEFSVPTANGIDMRAARFFRRIISVCSARSAFSPSPFRSRGLR